MKAKSFLGFLLLWVVASSSAQSGLDGAGLVRSLQGFNVTSHAGQLNTEASRKWWETVLNITTIVTADVAGGMGGAQIGGGAAAAIGLATGGVGFVVISGTAGVVGSAGASWGAYQGLPHRTLPVKPNYGNLLLSVPKKYAGLATIGREHNEVLDMCYAKGRPLSAFYLPKLRAEQVAIIESALLQQTFSRLNQLGAEHISQAGTVEELAAKMVANGFMTKQQQGVYVAFMKKMQVAASPKDMEGLINHAMRVTAESTLSELEKTALISGFIVASQSPFYINPPL